MKLKAFVAAGLVASASCAMATVSSSNTLCRIEVASPSAETILAVPLIEIGGSTQEIAITNLVLASSLSVNDLLMYKDGDKWYSWKVNTEHNWEALSTSSGSQAPTTAGVNAQFARGRGVWLVRADTSSKIYLYGQCDAGTTTTAFSKGTKASPVYTLMGNPKEEAFAPNSKTWTGCAQGDKIAFANSAGKAKTYTYRTELLGWCKPSVDENGAATWVKLGADDTIPAGQGFWYVSVGDSSGSVTW